MDKIGIKHCTSFICNGSQIQNDIPQLEGLLNVLKYRFGYLFSLHLGWKVQVLYANCFSF